MLRGLQQRNKLAEVVREACAELGRTPQEAKEVLIAIDQDWCADLQTLANLSEQGWRDLRIPALLKEALRRRCDELFPAPVGNSNSPQAALSAASSSTAAASASAAGAVAPTNGSQPPQPLGSIGPPLGATSLPRGVRLSRSRTLMPTLAENRDMSMSAEKEHEQRRFLLQRRSYHGDPTAASSSTNTAVGLLPRRSSLCSAGSNAEVALSPREQEMSDRLGKLVAGETDSAPPTLTPAEQLMGALRKSLFDGGFKAIQAVTAKFRRAEAEEDLPIGLSEFENILRELRLPGIEDPALVQCLWGTFGADPMGRVSRQAFVSTLCRIPGEEPEDLGGMPLERRRLVEALFAELRLAGQTTVEKLAASFDPCPEAWERDDVDPPDVLLGFVRVVSGDDAGKALSSASSSRFSSACCLKANVSEARFLEYYDRLSPRLSRDDRFEKILTDTFAYALRPEQFGGQGSTGQVPSSPTSRRCYCLAAIVSRLNASAAEADDGAKVDASAVLVSMAEACCDSWPGRCASSEYLQDGEPRDGATVHDRLPPHGADSPPRPPPASGARTSPSPSGRATADAVDQLGEAAPSTLRRQLRDACPAAIFSEVDLDILEAAMAALPGVFKLLRAVSILSIP
eukprot:TRINITY_DN49536_c0_g1_i1.p1 TRINITY_DN49536_c0_g1~~TRINITY_DN49536_c0_g1_i1.p1  ORF type:complete len:628 (-),score=102.87 TRINITY_DN49536_c0_g1_i1:202-2085(-)